MGVMVGSIGLVYGTLFNQPMDEYLPMVGMGFVVWGLIAGILNDACYAYINSANYIRQSDAPLWIYVLQVVWRQIIIFAHNFVIVIAILAVFGIDHPVRLLLFFPGLILLIINLTWMGQLVAILSVRYRDVPQLVASMVQVLFYITPLMWRQQMLTKHTWLITFNPFASFVDIVRSPLLGQFPALSSWITTGVLAIIGWILVMIVTRRTFSRIAYWI
jgi:lipopolysaccharide transport system permease protein